MGAGSLAVAGAFGLMMGAMLSTALGHSLSVLGLVTAAAAGFAYVIMRRGEAAAGRWERSQRHETQAWLVAGCMAAQALGMWCANSPWVPRHWHTATMLIGMTTALGLLVPACIIGARQRRRERDPGVCAFCGYTIAGLPADTCPECGRPVRLRFSEGEASGAGDDAGHRIVVGPSGEKRE
jgi:hypothetical protein